MDPKCKIQFGSAGLRSGYWILASREFQVRWKTNRDDLFVPGSANRLKIAFNFFKKSFLYSSELPSDLIKLHFTAFSKTVSLIMDKWESWAFHPSDCLSGPFFLILRCFATGASVCTFAPSNHKTPNNCVGFTVYSECTDLLPNPQLNLHCG